MSELDQDFESLVARINVKLQEAAAALKEVNELLPKTGLDSLIYSTWMREESYRKHSGLWKKESGKYNDDEIEEAIEKAIEAEQALIEKFDTGPLESQLNRAGWSTSSSYC